LDKGENDDEEPQVEQISTQKTQTSKKKSKDYFAFLYRIKLDVTVNAPIIIVPQNSSSTSALYLDCILALILINRFILVYNT
jgi:hypothetical protein